MQVSSLLRLPIGVFNSYLGTSITPLTLAIVEMDVGIIAATLIVMRPCFDAVRSAVSKPCQSRGTDVARTDPHETSSRVSRLPQDKGIVRTIEFELECHPTSPREVTPRDLL